MSIFGDMDMDSVPDNPYDTEPGTYEANVYDVEVKPTKAGDKTGMYIYYKIDGGDFDGNTLQEFKEIPQPKDPKNPTADEKKTASWLKMRLVSLGVPSNRLNSLDPKDLIGTPVTVTIARNGEYTNIQKVALRSDNGFTGSGVQDNPFATAQ